MMNPQYDMILKVLLVGESYAGKTSLMNRLSNKYDNSVWNFPIMTIGIEFVVRTFQIEDTIVKVQIWDNSRDFVFSKYKLPMYRGVHGVFLVYDISDNTKFELITKWIEEMESFTKDSISKILVGNKCDLEDQRKVSKQAGMDLAERYGMLFIETSAKTTHNVEEAIMLMLKEILARAGGPKQGIAQSVDLE